MVCGILTHTQGANWNPQLLWWKYRVLTTGPSGKFPHRIYFKKYLTLINYVVVVQLLSHVQLFVALWTAACQASLSSTISWSLLKLMSIESVMPSNHLVLCGPLLLLPSIFPRIRAFPISHLFPLGGQNVGASTSALALPMNIQDWFPLGWTGWFPCYPKGSQESSQTPQFKSINSLMLSFSLRSNSHIHT